MRTESKFLVMLDKQGLTYRTGLESDPDFTPFYWSNNLKIGLLRGHVMISLVSAIKIILHNHTVSENATSVEHALESPHEPGCKES